MADRKLLPSQVYLQECFDYDPESGDVFWRVRPLTHFRDGTQQTAYTVWHRWNMRYSLTRVGSVRQPEYASPYGYQCVLVGVDGENHMLARLLFKLIHGRDPVNVDHKDGNPFNMAACNLREATISQNTMNTGARRNNKTGLKGVFWFRTGYAARICVNRKTHHLGTFRSPEEAHEAYKKAAARLHGSFAKPD